MVAKLTAKQERFVSEYLLDLNATQAAIRAGYSAKTANRIGPQLLVKSWISEEIQKAMQRREKRTEITADRVLQELARIGFSDPRKLFDANGDPANVCDLDDDTAAAIAGVDTVTSYPPDGETMTYTKKYKMADKLKALELLGKHLGMFDQRRYETESDSGGIVMLPDVMEDESDA